MDAQALKVHHTDKQQKEYIIIYLLLNRICIPYPTAPR
ncbi:hypothetical protein HNR03_000030 [Pseudomonas sp. JAI111]|nr:hypothetical protein [Pseudomonas sp. JAI111]